MSSGSKESSGYGYIVKTEYWEGHSEHFGMGRSTGRMAEWADTLCYVLTTQRPSADRTLCA